MKIRNGFVSNSSSSSFIVISPITGGDYLTRLRKMYAGDVLVVDKNFGSHKFGWENEEYYDLGSKVCFAFIQAEYLVRDYYGEQTREKGMKWMKMLESVIKDKMQVTEVVWNITTEYGEKAEGKDYAYIDHQSASYEGENTEMFESEEALANFLFGGSYIKTGNDNE